MADMEIVVDEAKVFVQRTRAITLETLLDEAPSVQEEFDHFKLRVEATKGFWIRMNGWDKMTKPDLVELATQHQCVFRANESRSGLLAKVVHAHWGKLDAAKALDEAQSEAVRIRVWARRLNEVPENLQQLLTDGEAFFERWKKEQTGNIWDAAAAVRREGLALMEIEWASRKAREVLRDLKQGQTLAGAVKDMGKDVQMAIMGIIATNFSASGVGMEHMSAVGGAKLLTRAFYKAVPEEAQCFLATVYT